VNINVDGKSAKGGIPFASSQHVIPTLQVEKYLLTLINSYRDEILPVNIRLFRISDEVLLEQLRSEPIYRLGGVLWKTVKTFDANAIR
jgi:hypothetical protein